MIDIRKYLAVEHYPSFGKEVYILRIIDMEFGLVKDGDEILLSNQSDSREAELTKRDLISLLRQITEKGYRSKIMPSTPSEFQTRFFNDMPFEAVYFSHEEIDKLLSWVLFWWEGCDLLFFCMYK